MRLDLGLSVDEMGAVRYEEMIQMAHVLDLADLTVLDFPDGGLKELDPRLLEAVIADHIAAVRPVIVVTYPVHGISGFHDHLVAHAVVKRTYVKLRDQSGIAPARLAFFTLTEEQAERASKRHRLSGSTEAEIDCLVTVEEKDMDAFRRALDAYATYQETIEQTGVRTSLDRTVAFEFYRESFDPPVRDLCTGTLAAESKDEAPRQRR